MTMNKTVYFLGAGFSADAGGPIQNGIIVSILSDEFAETYRFKNQVIDARNKFISFIQNDLQIPEDLWNKIPLEDIFTPIDRSISNGRSFKKYDSKKLVTLREEFHYLMGAAIQFGVDDSSKDKQYVNDFATYINSIAKERLNNIKNDKIAIITTNWDILLDNSLNDIAQTYCQVEKSTNSDKLAVVDYCCYISSLQNDPYIKPGLLALGKGGYNMKYLKLHGSMNWLHCPSCQRMFVKYGVKTMLNDPKFCKHCKSNYNLDREKSIELKSNLMLPTFLKDLSNIQIQLVWQNAGIELSEASKVVFVGYSLPQADFEIRQLLSRCIPNHAEVEVVLFPGKDKSKTIKDFEYEINNYKTFFGSRIKGDESFILKTVPDYVSSLGSNDIRQSSPHM